MDEGTHEFHENWATTNSYESTVFGLSYTICDAQLLKHLCAVVSFSGDTQRVSCSVQTISVWIQYEFNAILRIQPIKNYGSLSV